MYHDELKKEVFAKISKYNQINQKISKIEDEFSEIPVEELIDEHEEYGPLCYDLLDLESEIEKDMIDSKYLLFFGLSTLQKKELIFFSEVKSLDFEKNMEKHLDFKLAQVKDSIKKRLQNVKSLRLTVNIHSRVYHLYSEAIRCYIYGAFEASSVLCRAISETIAKKHIETTQYKELLYGRKKPDREVLSIAQILKKLSIDEKIISIYRKIGGQADAILHNKNVRTDESIAYKQISYLQSFITKFYKDPDFVIESI